MTTAFILGIFKINYIIIFTIEVIFYDKINSVCGKVYIKSVFNHLNIKQKKPRVIQGGVSFVASFYYVFILNYAQFEKKYT